MPAARPSIAILPGRNRRTSKACTLGLAEQGHCLGSRSAESIDSCVFFALTCQFNAISFVYRVKGQSECISTNVGPTAHAGVYPYTRGRYGIGHQN